MTWDTSVEISRYFILSEDKENQSFLIFFQDRIATDFQKTKLITYSKGCKFLLSLWKKNYKCGSLCNKRMFPIMPRGFYLFIFLISKAFFGQSEWVQKETKDKLKANAFHILLKNLQKCSLLIPKQTGIISLWLSYNLLYLPK